MYYVRPDATIIEYQDFIRNVYGKPNDLHFDLGDMLSQIQRFAMRGMKGIRQRDNEKALRNFLVSLSWFASTANRLHINLEEVLWKRFPYLCSYCATAPCICIKERIDRRQEIVIDESKKPSTMKDFQEMFKNIYLHENQNLDQVAVHLSEELGEFSEALLHYRGEHKEYHFENVCTEAADILSCFFTLFNKLGFDTAHELSKMFDENCHVCRAVPCKCEFSDVMGFKS